MMVHTLKIAPTWYAAVTHPDPIQRKTVEIRAEDTRRFASGDELVLREWDAAQAAAAVEWRIGLAAADGAFVGFAWPCGPDPAADLALLLSGLAAAGVRVIGVDPTPAPAEARPDCGAPLYPDLTQLSGPSS